ncbi:MAG: HD domain-containing protein [Pseudomonadales bacterium]
MAYLLITGSAHFTVDLDALEKMDVTSRAKRFARLAHSSINHVRKYSGQRYTVHTEEVARLVAATGVDDATVAAALLHDVIEDKGVTETTLRPIFGDDITSLVLEVTNISRSEDGNRQYRKALDLAHIANASNRGQSIKAADIIENTCDLLNNDPAFSLVYFPEKLAQLGVLNEANPALLKKAYANIHQHNH